VLCFNVLRNTKINSLAFDAAIRQDLHIYSLFLNPSSLNMCCESPIGVPIMAKLFLFTWWRPRGELELQPHSFLNSAPQRDWSIEALTYVIRQLNVPLLVSSPRFHGTSPYDAKQFDLYPNNDQVAIDANRTCFLFNNTILTVHFLCSEEKNISNNAGEV